MLRIVANKSERRKTGEGANPKDLQGMADYSERARILVRRTPFPPITFSTVPHSSTDRLRKQWVRPLHVPGCAPMFSPDPLPKWGSEVGVGKCPSAASCPQDRCRRWRKPGRYGDGNGLYLPVGPSGTNGLALSLQSRRTRALHGARLPRSRVARAGACQGARGAPHAARRYRSNCRAHCRTQRGADSGGARRLLRAVRR